MLYARAFVGWDDKIVWHGIRLAFARTSLILNNCIFKKEINAKNYKKIPCSFAISVSSLVMV